MTAYAGHRSLRDYITRRARQRGLLLIDVARKLKWKKAYIYALRTGQFVPSHKRLAELAAVFGDEPHILYVLAGLERPPKRVGRLLRSINDTAQSLTPAQQREADQYLRYLKERK